MENQSVKDISTEEKIDFIYKFIKELVVLVSEFPKYNKNGIKIYNCEICKEEYFMHKTQCVSSRIKHFGTPNICWECLKKKELKKII